MKRRQKARSRAGFTLAETLLAVLILLMVTAIVASGIPVARNAYEKVILASNAQLLLSTTVAALRNELGTAREVAVDMVDGTQYLSYISADTGAWTRLYVEKSSEKSIIMRQDYAKGTEFFRKSNVTEGTGYPLLPEAASTDNLSIGYDDVTYKNGVITFTGLIVKSKTNSDLAKLDDDKSTLMIRPFSALIGPESADVTEEP